MPVFPDVESFFTYFRFILVKSSLSLSLQSLKTGETIC